MKNFAQKAGLAIGAGLVLAFPFLANAQAYSTSTAVTSVTGNISDVASIIGGVVGAILALMAALIGLGWGVRKFQRHVSGRKF